MKDVIAALFETALDQLIEAGILEANARKAVHVENTKDPKHGDLATNVALIHAGPAKMEPRNLAKRLIAVLPKSTDVAAIKIAGPGFINIHLAQVAAFAPIRQCLAEPNNFGLHVSTGKRIHIEYVSANPTGPLHVGHGRGAAYGATLINILKARGHQVEGEYYINDAGRQMNILSVSVFLRYLEICGCAVSFPSGGYQGDYIHSLSQKLYNMYGDVLKIDDPTILPGNAPPDSEKLKDAHIDAIIASTKASLGRNWEKLAQLAVQTILNEIQHDLKEFGAHFDQWFSEQSLIDSGEIDQVISTLQTNGHIYEKKGALWFRSKAFGDEKDRVVCRDNGETTYFASDIAYIANKFQRGFDFILYIWGADHHGYINRIKAATQALGFDSDRIIIRLVQFANLFKNTKRLQMSTRSGAFVTLRELREEIGCDACRYFYIMRKADQHLDFDLTLATEQSKDNPVYYVQYAHARICSVFASSVGRKFAESRGLHQLEKLNGQSELNLAMAIGKFPEVVCKAADTLEVHLLCYYLRDLASEFHRWYNSTRLLTDDTDIRDARLCLAKAVQITLRRGLTLIGVSAPESM